MGRVEVVRLGRMRYGEALDAQLERRRAILAGAAESTLFLVEHEPVITLGAGFHEANLLLSRAEYLARGIEILPTGRGGDVTFHGHGQLVAYPVFDLRRFRKDLHRWLRDMEEVFMRVVTEFGLTPRRFPPHTGVWIGDAKVAAIGVQVSRWVSIHGVALNCDSDLAPFETIVPCGIQGYGVTSLSKELDRQVTIVEAEPAVLRSFASVFDIELHG
ncbi:MAG TPA: lipoyl(octanoyl) transferase LipB [Fimbriimonadaceae bacterium]|nr:lipoyl(octanoyl) transferase LipB [Fimbriimonadaceae bacterium]